MNPRKLESCSTFTNYFQGFPQPKAIRDNSGYFRQEIYYPGSTGNHLGHHQQNLIVDKPIFAPTIRTVPIPVSIPLESQPIVVDQEEPVIDTSAVHSVHNRYHVVAAPLPPTVPTTTRPRTTTEPATSEELEEQSRSAFYKFGTSVHDTINDHEHVRQEVREGLTLKGMYSYSDGFFRRSVHYEADEDGYRVVKEEIEPIGDGEGPKFNPKGQAAVKSTLNGAAGDYSITVGDFKLNKQQEEFIGKL